MTKLVIAQNVNVIVNKIILVRGQKVILDSDIAQLYGVPTKRLNEQVKRNQERFPSDFMFSLTWQEFSDLKSQIATSSPKTFGGRRKLPNAFTEQGVAMLSSVLRSPKATQVNIAIIRAFVHLRKLIQTNSLLAKKIHELEARSDNHDKQFQDVYRLINKLIK